MRWLFAFLTCAPLALALLCAVASAGEAPSTAPSKPIAGYFDPSTNIFTPLPPSAAGAPAAGAPVVISGRLIIRATVAIAPSIPPSAEITAGGRLNFTDGKYTIGVGRQVDAIRSGNSAQVTVAFQYQIAAKSRAVPMTVSLFVRSSSTGIPFFDMSQDIPLPANGLTTTVTFPGSL